jgi:signal transduction histidine kinase
VYFAVLLFFVSLYPGFNYLALQDPERAHTWAKFILLSAIPVGPLFYLFVKTFPSNRFVVNRLAKVFLGWAIINIILAFSNLIFKAVVIVNGQPQIQPGPAVPSFGLLQVSSLLCGSVVLFQKYRRATGILKVQLLYITIGIITSFALTLTATLILPLSMGITALLPVSPLFLLIAAIASAYSIVRHRLLDIRVVVARSVVYVLLMLSMALIYGLLIFGSTSFIFTAARQSMVQNTINIGLALILAFTFQPLRRFFERITDKVFFRDRYNSEAVINDVTKVLASQLDLEKLLDGSLDIICRSLRVGYAQFIIFNHDKIYKVAHFGPLPGRLMTLPTLDKLGTTTVVVADELERGDRKDVMDEHGVRVSVRLRTKDQFVGYLLLGDKQSGAIYTDQDLEVLDILSQELAIAILNAKAYAEISRFNITLQQEIERATAKLRVANENLKALDKTKDEFLSMASHQLRTPLTTIKGYLSMLAEGDAGSITKDQKEYLNYAIGGAQRMVGLISDLLNVTRLSAGRFIIEKRPVDIAQIVEDEIRQLEGHAEAKHLKLTFIPPAAKLPLVQLDEGKTRQVIMNFIDNAIYYTPKGEVSVLLEAGKANFRLLVRDTGIGVPKEAQAKLFSKFFRAENAQAVRPDGTGLGLYLAKRVVEDQGGKIIFESQEGKGSTFGFEMPIRASDKTRASIKPPAAAIA